MKKYKPITSSLRHVLLVSHAFSHKIAALKSLTYYMVNSAGRTNAGRCSLFNRGGGRRMLYRIVDFKRCYYGLQAEVVRIEYDPSRTAFIALLLYRNGFYSYIIAPFQLLTGGAVISSASMSLSMVDIGCTGTLRNIPAGTMIHNLELSSGFGGKLMRSAGSFGMLLRKEGSFYSVVRLRSGERRYISSGCFATIGSVSNLEHRYVALGKAGRRRWLNRRPCVRGVAMNPVDHPHGGDTSGGKVHMTPWSIPTKGKPTRRTVRGFLAHF